YTASSELAVLRGARPPGSTTGQLQQAANLPFSVGLAPREHDWPATASSELAVLRGACPPGTRLASYIKQRTCRSPWGSPPREHDWPATETAHGALHYSPSCRCRNRWLTRFNNERSSADRLFIPCSWSRPRISSTRRSSSCSISSCRCRRA